MTTTAEVLDRTAALLGGEGIVLPTFAQLTDPSTIPASVKAALKEVDPDTAHPLNLFRVHWYNGPDRRSFVDVPYSVELPSALTGVKARIVVMIGAFFPLIRAHKVLPAYACLAPRLLSGEFDPQKHRAVWPSTGNYCRGGVAISKILGCRGVAVLPEGMSRERFDWLEAWVGNSSDIVRTPGTESNVKEIYDACHDLARQPQNRIFNQFSEFANYVVHRLVTGRALGHVFEDLREDAPDAKLAAFVAATGSAGTIAAGDALKAKYGSKTVTIEPVECPTLLYNGFGHHNIQGIGDKHLPLIHNVLNNDAIVGVSDQASDSLNLLFNTDAGRDWLARAKGIDADLLDQLKLFGLSSLANVAGAIKLAKAMDYGPDDVILTVATDSAAMYGSELDMALDRDWNGRFDDAAAAEVFGRHLRGLGTDHVLDMTEQDRNRVFNLGYFTWVEQQGVSLEDFVRRRDQAFWDALMDQVPQWDAEIAALNGARAPA